MSFYSVIMPGAVIEDGASVEYAIVGENTVIHSAAHVGAPPDGTDAWGVATCGPNIEIRGSASVPAGAMIYTGGGGLSHVRSSRNNFRLQRFP